MSGDGANDDGANDDGANDDGANDDGGSRGVSRYMCYALVNTQDRRTYVGYTTDPERRLRQHNGEIKGGAWATARSNRRAGTPQAGAWRFLFVVGVETGVGGPDQEEAWTSTRGLSLEWHLKRRRRVVGAVGAVGAARRRRSTHRGTAKVAARQAQAKVPALPSLRGVPLRIDGLVNALTHPKFHRFASRFVVLAADDVMDDVWAGFADLPWQQTPALLSLHDLWADRPARGRRGVIE
jgi:hypothetical protein